MFLRSVIHLHFRKSVMIRSSFGLLLSLLTFSFQLRAQTPTDALQISVTAPEEALDLLEGWLLTVTVKNISQKELTLQVFAWDLPPQLASTRPTADPTVKATDYKPNDTSEILKPHSVLIDTWSSANFLAQDRPMQAGATLPLQLWMPATRDTKQWTTFNSTVITWQSNELPVTILVRYTTDGGKTFSLAAQTIRVKFKTPFRTMVFGGFLGAVLAMLFYFTYLRLSVVAKFFHDRNKIRENQPLPPNVEKERASLLKALHETLSITLPEHWHIAWRQMITASVTVIIVLLFLASGNQQLLPVNLSVNNFVGAAFMGLLAHKLGKVAFDAIFGDKSPPETVRPESENVPLLSIQWDTATAQAKLTWTEVKDAIVKSYSVRVVTGGDESTLDNDKEVCLVPAGKPCVCFTLASLANVGDEATFRVVAILEDGTLRPSKKVVLKRTV